MTKLQALSTPLPSLKGPHRGHLDLPSAAVPPVSDNSAQLYIEAVGLPSSKRETADEWDMSISPTIGEGFRVKAAGAL